MKLATIATIATVAVAQYDVLEIVESLASISDDYPKELARLLGTNCKTELTFAEFHDKSSKNPKWA